jgi:cell wall-associated NlpC family hydrolase
LLHAVIDGRALLRRAVLPFVLLLALVFPLAATTVTARPAAAATTSVSKASASAAAKRAALRARAIRIARIKATRVRTALHTASRLRGRPYVYGATGPRAFDCSGFTGYVMRKAGLHLPRTAQQQYNRSHKISKRSMKAGDLIFFRSGRHVYHVALYAGHGKIWHARHPGAGVALTRITMPNWVPGRVI